MSILDNIKKEKDKRTENSNLNYDLSSALSQIEKENKKKVNFLMNKETHKLLKKISLETEVSMSSIIEQLIQEGIQQKYKNYL